MNTVEINLLKKVLSEILDSYSETCSNRGCNDIEESRLNLSNEEKEMAISLINYEFRKNKTNA
jgi:hypothetical protein